MKPEAESSKRPIGPERWQRIKAILDEVAELTAKDQRQAVADACAGAPDLEQEVLSFLEADDEIEDFIENPVWKLPPKNPDETEETESPTTGQRIGPYRIERLLGRGGMGAVFLAVREDDYRQQVALKLVNWGNESEDLLSRFYNERQILAQLEHPNIARLLDGGTTGDGRPYLVMEYVEGDPIDQYCDTRGLSIEERLRLFREVCVAVHFAHQNLIVHRDLKASNILVTRQGQPRLLDFGIAKLLAPELASQPVTTMPGQVPMTPAYASPEQALGDPITTATDVYALGVLLYRLLAGRLPFRFDGKKYPEIFRAICYQEPTRPSAVMLESTQGTGDDQPPTWVDQAIARPAIRTMGTSLRTAWRSRRRLAGDLDAIVLKAMRKEPHHRYRSALELSADLRRHLSGLPVQARQGTGLYLFARYLRRHKLAFAVMVLVAGSAVTSTVLWRRALHQQAHAEQQQARAERQQARAERVSGFLEDLFASADPDRGGDDLRVREVLELGREKIAADLEAEPELQAELLGTLGTVYQKLGIIDQARALKEEGLERRRFADSGPRLDLAKDLNNLASLLYASGDFEIAAERFREVVEMQRRLGQEPIALAGTQHNLASALMQRGRYEEAERLFQDVLAVRREHHGEDSPRVATSLYSLGALYSHLGAFDRAEPLLRQALEIRTAAYGATDTRVATVLSSLCWVFNAEGSHAEARECYERALAIRLERLGEDHPTIATTQKNLVAVLLALGETEAAGDLLDEILPILRRHSPRRDPWELADAEGLLGVFLTRSGRYAQAEPHLLTSYLTIRDLRGPSSDDTRTALFRVVELYSDWAQPEKVAEYRALLGPSHSEATPSEAP